MNKSKIKFADNYFYFNSYNIVYKNFNNQYKATDLKILNI